MASRYAAVWVGLESLLESARKVSIAECFDCDVEWNIAEVQHPHRPRQDSCPECGQTGTVTSP